MSSEFVDSITIIISSSSSSSRRAGLDCGEACGFSRGPHRILSSVAIRITEFEYLRYLNHFHHTNRSEHPTGIHTGGVGVVMRTPDVLVCVVGEVRCETSKWWVRAVSHQRGTLGAGGVSLGDAVRAAFLRRGVIEKLG